MPGRPQPPRPFRGAQARVRHVGFRCQKLGGAQPFELRIESLNVRELHHREASGRQIEPRQPEALISTEDARNHIIATFIQKRFVG